MTWRAPGHTWHSWAFVAALCIFAYASCQSLTGCTPSQRRAVVHVVADNCERLELPAPVCVAIEDLGPLLAVLLAAQREGRDAEVEIRDGGGVSHVYTVPLARIPGAVGSVSRAAIVASNRPGIPEGSR